jgi:hypothetical protein
MKKKSWLIPAGALVLAGGVSVLLAAEPAPNIVGETMAEVAARTGYTVEEIHHDFPAIAQWGALGLSPAPDAPGAGFAAERFSPPPAPGIHPRIYFNPEDLPTIRERLHQQRLPRMRMEALRGRLLQLSPRREDWEGLPYGAREFESAQKEFLDRGIRIYRRMGYHGPWVGGWVNELAEGNDPEGLVGHWHHYSSESNRRYLMHLMPYEAFRCLVDEDEAAAQRLAAALVTICRLFSQHLDVYGESQPDWQNIYWALSSDSIGVTYDWLFPYMTESQRAEVREFIAAVTRGKTFIGLDHLPAYPGNTTNWINIHMTLLSLVLSIEGEAGFDEGVYQRCIEGLRKWVYVANGPDGAPFEGYTKSTYAPQWLVVAAKRGHPFIGTQWSKNVLRRYALGMMLPWEAHCVYETGINATRDVAPFKYAYPNDPVIDLFYGHSVKGALVPDGQPGWVGTRSSYAPWWPDIAICEDPMGMSEEAGYDFDSHFDEVMDLLRSSGEPTTYYSDYRGVMTTRTAWGRNATFLFFEPRNVPGGHTWDSRNDFVLASHGRLWGNRPTATEGSSSRRSVILVDGKGQGHQCVQGRTVALSDRPEATFCVGDARWAYQFAAGHPDRDEPVRFTPNDSRLHPSPLPWMSKPWSYLPAWTSGKKGGDRHGHWRKHLAMATAFRTIGLVKGAHPYIVLVDDYRQDDEPHRYDWLMQVPDDVRLVASGRNDDGTFDLMLGDEQGRRLLLRVLAAGDGADVPEDMVAGARLETYEVEGRGRVSKFQRVVLPVMAVNGHYKILLFPYREGDPLPQVKEMGTGMVVDWDGRQDEIGFHLGDDGRTRLSIRCHGGELVRLD